MVAHALDVLGDEVEMHAGRDVPRILHHEGQELAEERVVHLVDVAVAQAHLLGKRRVALDVGIEGVLHHVLDLARHAPDRLRRALDGLHLDEDRGPLGHVLGVVAAAFEVGADLQHGQHRAQVGCGGRPQRDEPRRLFVHQFLERVDLLVGLPDPRGKLLVALFERDGGVADLRFDEPSHLHDMRLDGFEVAVEDGSDMRVPWCHVSRSVR